MFSLSSRSGYPVLHSLTACSADPLFVPLETQQQLHRSLACCVSGTTFDDHVTRPWVDPAKGAG